MRIDTIAADVVTLQVPFRFVKRGGRKEMVMPAGASAKRAQPDNTVVKALARAFRWRKMLESGEFATIGDLAAQEKIAPSYMTRVMRLTLLAPRIVEEVLDGTLGPEMTLARLLGAFPTEWSDQEARFR
jgi:hypothetical protein